MQFGGMDRLHIACFVKLRDQLEFYECGDQLPGFRGLTENDKAAVKTALPEIDKKHTAGEVEVDGPPPKKKIKLEKDVVTDSKEIEATKEQNKQMFKYRGALKVLETEGLSHILTYNNQDDTSGTERKLDRISDIMTYGALEACPSCKGGQLVYRDELEYQCTGDLTEWTKNVDEKPARTECQIPKNLLYKYSSLNLSKVERLTELGGKLESKLTKDITAVISTEDEVEKMSVEMKEAHIHDTRVVPATFIDACQDGKALDKMKELSISPWGSDPKTRVDSFSAKLMSSKSESQYERKSSSKVIVKVKGGYAVDPNSNLQDVAHVHKDMNGVWDATLIRTEVQSNENSFCKLQLLKSDETPQCWVFRVWGRIGTTIGGHQLEPLCCIHKAQKVFATVYETYTGNAWNERERFDKNPNLYCPVEIDYSVKAKPSKLSKAVQDLTTLLLDVDPMKEVIREFEIDLEKMPLGKLSKNQIEKARHVLSELQKTNGDIKSDDVIEASNRFYSLIPHDFGFNAPPLLDNKEIVQTKLEMLKSLEDTKVTCCLLNETTKGDDEENPIDAYYRKLNSDITVIDRDSDEFHTILNYVKNTHSSIHSNYTLDVLDVFRVKRNGDDSRFKPYEKLHNQKLLWHGSKLSNFPGILSQGLRIAPPEAPATGCMFGKGVYFADMVSKSANYSLPSLRDTNPIGLLLACQVALGEMYERTRKEYIEKLPPGKHSCKGVGAMCPDPDGSLITPDGVEIPCGKPKSVLGKSKTALDHNEYIVYDAARVKAKYLVKIKFKTTKKHRS